MTWKFETQQEKALESFRELYTALNYTFPLKPLSLTTGELLGILAEQKKLMIVQIKGTNLEEWIEAGLFSLSIE